MARISDRDIFIAALRELGGKAGNSVLRARLGWAEDRYWRKHSELFDERLIAKGRGYGGTAILAEARTAAPVEAESVSAAPEAASTPESALYEPVRVQLEAHWAQRKQLDHCHVEVTALQGRRDTGGSWTRPDLTLVGYRKYEFLPEKSFELVSFEIKASYDVSIKGVMEALAHREAATRSLVLFHTDGAEFESFPEATRITDLGARHGVGVYAAKRITDFDTWEEIVPAQRASPDPETMDGFLRRTLSDAGKSKLRKWF